MAEDEKTSIAAQELRMGIERIERLEEEKKGIADDIKGVKAELKARGYDVATINKILTLRKKTVQQRREEEALLDTYKAALGMLDGTPLGHWAMERLKPKKVAPAETALEAAAYRDAVQAVVTDQKASTSWLQRKLKVSYNVAARFIERMEAEGIVSTPDSTGKRKVLVAELPEDDGKDAAPPAPSDEVVEDQPAEPSEPQATVDDARRLGGEAARSGQPVTANPFPAYDERRAAWDEAWCAELGSDGMDLPDALKPTPKPKKGDSAQ